MSWNWSLHSRAVSCLSSGGRLWFASGGCTAAIRGYSDTVKRLQLLDQACRAALDEESGSCYNNSAPYPRTLYDQRRRLSFLLRCRTTDAHEYMTYFSASADPEFIRTSFLANRNARS